MAANARTWRVPSPTSNLWISSCKRIMRPVLPGSPYHLRLRPSSRGVSKLLQMISVKFPVQRPSADAYLLRRQSPVSVRFFQRPDNELFFSLLHRQVVLREEMV